MASDYPSSDPTNKNIRFYKATLEDEDVSPAARELLENYSHIPPEKVNSHIQEIRERAWHIHPYPCIGQFRFLNLSIAFHPSYPRILSLLKSQPQSTLLDLGCCFAQDIRKLVHDGAPSASLYASDLHPEFLDLGYDLFLDRTTLSAKMFAADVFASSGRLSDIEGEIDFVYTSSFLHLFGWEQQVAVCKRIVRLLRPQPGSCLFGRQVGTAAAKVVERERGAIWRHDAESFVRMWELVGRETGTKWKTWAELDEAEGMGEGHWWGEDVRRLRFEVVRVE